MSRIDNNKRKYLTLAALSMGGMWVKPIVNAVMLPVHATTSIVACSTSAWHFDVTFLEARCEEDTDCAAIPYGEVITLSTDQHGFLESYLGYLGASDICLSEEELDAGVFNRDNDFGSEKYGRGPASDYIYIRYTIAQQSELAISGTIRTYSVDTFEVVTGIWTATRIV